MSAIYPLSVHRRIERQWAGRLDALRRAPGQIVAGTEKALQCVFKNDDALVALPLGDAVGRLQLDPPQSDD